MNRYVVLGSIPGEGGVFRAKSPKDAIIKYFMCADGISRKNVISDLQRGKHKIVRIKKGKYRFGSYEINKIT